MVIRAHRAAAALACWRYAFNSFHRGYDRGEDWNLRDGTALHAGIQMGRSSGDWEAAKFTAIAAADASFERFGFPGEEQEAATHSDIIGCMVDKYVENWAPQDVKVISPELEFEIPLPNSEHLCVMNSWRGRSNGSRLGMPPAGEILSGWVRPDEFQEEQPHYLAGRTDALIEWNGATWLDEFKTTAIWGNRFWDEWLLDLQPTIYLYGIWKTLGILPKGFILHGFYKPSEAQVKDWNSRRKGGATKKEIQDYIKYDRQLFLRSKEDLERVEREMIDLADEWEWRVSKGKFPMANYRGGPCISWGKKCVFHKACFNHEELGFEGLRQATEDKTRLYHIEGRVK